MGVKIGTFTMPASGPFQITGLGFKPRWIIFLFSNMGTEDVWTAGPSAGVGATGILNSANDTSGVPPNLRTCQISEIWQGDGVGGSFLGDVTMWVRATRGGGGWAAYTNAMLSDGFQMTFSSGFTSGASGRIIHYIAGDENWEYVSMQNAFVPGSSDVNLGWEPNAFFGIGAGGPLNAPEHSYTLFDRSVDAATAGGWDDEGDKHVINMWRGILDPNVNVQSWWGYDQNGFATTVLEPQDSGGAQFSSRFDPAKTVTQLVPSWITGGGFSSGHARMQCIVLGEVASVVGRFTPSSTVGVWNQVDLPITPEFVFFYSPQDNKSGVFNTSVYGATGWGFCDATEQRMLAYGGFWNPPTAFQSNGIISSQRAWVGNCIETGAIGTVVSSGSARVTPAGFEHRTDEHAASTMYEVLYWAVGPKQDDLDMWMMDI